MEENNKKIENYLLEKNLNALEQTYNEEHPADIAQELGNLECEDLVKVLKVFDIHKTAEIISYLNQDQWSCIEEHFEPKSLAKIFNVMAHDDRVDFIKTLSPAFQRQVLYSMAKEEREDVKRLSQFSDDSVGSIMTTDYVSLFIGQTVSEAFKVVQTEAIERETVNRLYVINDDRKYLGSVRLTDLVLSKENTPISDIIDSDTPFVPLDTTKEEAAHMISKYDVVALPVVDLDGNLVGIITYDDAMDVIKEEATLAIHKSGTIGRLGGSAQSLSSWILYKKRIVWLIVLVFGNIFSGAGIAFFEDIIENNVALVFFLPLLIDSGGNAGSQSATLMVRSLATGEIFLKDWAKMISKEIFIALGLGVTMALAVSVIGVFRGGPEIALVVSLTMVIVVTVGSLIGMSLPFLLSKFNFDPATASAPLITSIADAAGVIIYFTIATILLL